jgi:DNA-binding response OmpR family regulator
MNIIVVEDQMDLQEELVYFLCRIGHEAQGVSCGHALDQVMQLRRPDLLLLDIGLPGQDGIAIAERLHRTPGLAIVMLTARSGEEDRIRSFEGGADSYLVKPVNYRELQAVLARASQRLNPGAVPKPVGWQLMRRERLLQSPAGAGVLLTGSELCLLEVLARQGGKVAGRRQLIEAMGFDFMTFDERRLEVKMSRLRKKIRNTTGADDLVKSDWGVGYVFMAECFLN